MSVFDRNRLTYGRVRDGCSTPYSVNACKEFLYAVSLVETLYTESGSVGI